MTSEKQKYISVTVRNIGFALTAPAASIVFQWIVFRKNLFFGHSVAAMILFTLAWLFIAIGYMVLWENK